MKNSANPSLRKRAVGTKENAKEMKTRISPSERSDVSPEMIEQISLAMDGHSSIWQNLSIGERLELD